MSKYKITYGLGGSFGENEEIVEFPNADMALKEAYYLAIQEYESYEGLHGIRSLSNIMEDEDCSEEEAQIIYEDEIESVIDYWVEIIEE